MIPLELVIPLAALVLSTVMAAGIVARDPGLLIHRLAGALLAATAWWALCEVLWQLQDDAASAVRLVRLSGLGWMSLGPICLHMFSEITGRPPALRRIAVPVAYACAVAGMIVYTATPDIVSAHHTEAWGWGYDLAPSFFVPYAIAVTPPTAVLLLWRRFNPGGALIGGERNVSRTMFAGVVFALAVTLVSEVALPMLGVQWLHLGTAGISLVAAACALLMTRYGFSLLSPSAFAREILDTLGDGVLLSYQDRTVRFANRAFEELVGAAPGGLAGRTVDSLLPGIREELETGAEVAELELVTGAGRRLPVAVTAVRIGGLSRPLVVRDLREIRSLRDRVVTGGRLATVGELSAAIAREIDAPSERVARQLEAFRRRWHAAAEANGAAPGANATAAGASGGTASRAAILADGEELIEESLEGVERVRTIARSVGYFESGGERSEAPEDLNALVEACLRELAAGLPETVRIERTFGSVPRVRCVAGELAQAVRNLVANAIDAVQAGGRILVATGADAREAWISVSDDGPGISPAVRDRMFDPFFTTKPTGEGIGLGLPVSFHMIERHGGELRHESGPEGTRFEVRLPLGG